MPDNRPETGNMRFGDDWTGVFFRGDCAGPLGMYLGQAISMIERGFYPPAQIIGQMKRLQRTLQACDENKSGDSRPEAQIAALVEPTEVPDAR